MTLLEKTEASLRFFGEDLHPDQVTKLLGSPPTHAETKGKRVDYPVGSTRIAKRGSWRLHATSRHPGNLDAQIEEIFSKLTNDMEVWRKLTSDYSADLFCGLFLANWNDGESLSPKSLKMLADRNIALGLDIYQANDNGND